MENVTKDRERTQRVLAVRREGGREKGREGLEKETSTIAALRRNDAITRAAG